MAHGAAPHEDAIATSAFGQSLRQRAMGTGCPIKAAHQFLQFGKANEF
jgi:hypothetical protein